MTQSSSIPKSQWSNYRPIAPLIAPQKILPRPEQVPEKRKWEGLEASDLPTKHHGLCFPLLPKLTYLRSLAFFFFFFFFRKKRKW
jgi:hypothetical protein